MIYQENSIRYEKIAKFQKEKKKIPKISTFVKSQFLENSQFLESSQFFENS